MEYYISLDITKPTEEKTSETLEENGYFPMQGINNATVYGKRIILPRYSSQIPKEEMTFIEQIEKPHNILLNHPTLFKKYEITEKIFDAMEEKPSLKEKEDGTKYWFEAMDLNESREVNIFHIKTKKGKKKKV